MESEKDALQKITKDNRKLPGSGQSPKTAVEREETENEQTAGFVVIAGDRLCLLCTYT